MLARYSFLPDKKVITHQNKKAYKQLNTIYKYLLIKCNIQQKLMQQFPEKKSINDNQIMQKLDNQQKQKFDLVEWVSPHKQEYQSFFRNVPLQKIYGFYENLSKNKIKFFQSLNPHSEYQLQIVDETKNSTAINLLVYIGRFEFNIRILNLNGKSPSVESLIPLDSGANGLIFYYKGNNENFVIKSVVYCKNQNQNFHMEMIRSQNLIHDIIVQYCFCKLFSVLRIGPSVKDYLGFDLLIYKNTAEFAMQYCPQLQNNQQFLEQDLSQSLWLMHSLNFVHGDIKPNNIRYSQSFKKAVFIDFGYCMSPGQPIGSTILTSFFGTPPYSCPQMMETFRHKTKKLVDVYYNDVCALKRTFQELKNLKINFKSLDKPSTLNYRQTTMHKYQKFLLNTRLKSQIYQRNITKVKMLCQSNRGFVQIDEIKDLIAQMRPSTKLAQILNYLISKYQPFTKVNKDIAFFYPFKLQNSIQNKKEEQKGFKKRIVQVSPNSLSKLHKDQIIVFIKLICKQDLSIAAKLQKYEDFKLINKCMQQQRYQFFWQLFVKVLENVYTTRQEVLIVLEMAKIILKFESWQQTSQPEYETAIKIFQVTKKAKEIFGMDLYQLWEKKGEQKIVTFQQLNYYLKDSQTAEKIYTYAFNQRQQPMKKVICNLYQKLKNDFEDNFLVKLITTFLKFIIKEGNQDLMFKLCYDQIIEKLVHSQKYTKSSLYYISVADQITKQIGIRNSVETLNAFHSTLNQFYHYAFYPGSIVNFQFYTKIFNKLNKQIQISSKNQRQLGKSIEQFIRLFMEKYSSQYYQRNFRYFCIFYLKHLSVYFKSRSLFRTCTVAMKTIIKQFVTFYNKCSQSLTFFDLRELFQILISFPQQINEKQREILQQIGWQSKQFELFNSKQLSLGIFRGIKDYLKNHPEFQINFKLKVFKQQSNMLLHFGFISNTQYARRYDDVIEQYQLIRPAKDDMDSFILMNSFRLNKMLKIQQRYKQKINIVQEYLTYAFNNRKQFSLRDSIILLYFLQYKPGYQTQHKIHLIMSFIKFSYLHPQLSLNSIPIYILTDFFLKNYNLLLFYTAKNKIRRLIKHQLQISKQKFFTVYADLIVVIQHFLEALNNFQNQDQVQAARLCIKLIKYANRFYYNCKSSFILSRFKIVAQVICYKLIKNKFIFHNQVRRRKNVALLKCIRAPQFFTKKQILDLSTKPIAKRLLKTQSELFSSIKDKIEQKINRIRMNKLEQVQKNSAKIRPNFRYFIEKYLSLVNQKQVGYYQNIYPEFR